MEVLVLWMVLAGFAAVWFAPFAVSVALWGRETRRIAALQRRLDLLEAAVAAPVSTAAPEARPGSEPEPEPAVELEPEPAGEPEPEPASEPEPERVVPPAAPPRPALEWPSPERVVVWVAAALGGLAAVVAALLALVAAIERGWVGPAARASGGLVLGTSLWVAGAWLRGRDHRWVASALSGAGIGTLYGALFAASGLYRLVPPAVGGAAMVAVTLVGTLRAVRTDDRFVAWLTLIGGALTPWLVSSGEDRPYHLFLYLSLLATGMVFAASRRGWWDLVLGVAVAVGLLFVGWGDGMGAERVLPALVGAALLSGPFAVAAAARAPRLHTAGAVAGAALALLATPWVGPVDTGFEDPWTGASTVVAAPGSQLAAVIASCWLPIPLVLAGRWRGHALGGTAGAVVAGILTLSLATGWGAADLGDPMLVALGVGGPTLLAAVMAAGHSNTARALLALLPVAGIAGAIASEVLAGPALGLTVGAWLAASALLGVSSGRGFAAFGALAAVAPLLALQDPSRSLLWVAGTACAALAATAQLPVLWRWREHHTWAWGSAALAGLALFPALHAVWVEAFGDGFVGLLPLLLAANALLGALALVRRGEVGRDDTATAVFAGAVLLGVVAAVPLQLQERWLTVAWALEAAALAAMSHRVRHPLLRWTAVALSCAVAIRLVVNPWALAWGSAGEGWPVLNWTLYTWGVPLVCILLVARWGRLWVAPLSMLAALVGFALVNVQVSHAFQDAGPLELGGAGRLQGMVRSASWAAYGLGVLGLGLWRDTRWVRLVGFGFVMLATVKGFAFDLWGLSGFVRVGSLASLAVSLLLAALVFERLVLRSRKED